LLYISVLVYIFGNVCGQPVDDLTVLRYEEAGLKLF